MASRRSSPAGSSTPSAGRARVLDELLQTERSYVSSLAKVVDNFVRLPGTQAALGGKRAEVVAQNIERILDANRGFLADLEAGLGRSGANLVGPVLRRFLSRATPLYLEYVNGFPAAVQELDSADKSVAAVRTLLREFRSHPSCGGLGVQSFLIMPVQRLPRYKLLCRELAKASEADEQCGAQERAVLSATVEAVDAVTSKIDASVRQAENMTKLLSLQNTGELACGEDGGGG
eukprot:g1831.t1